MNLPGCDRAVRRLDTVAGLSGMISALVAAYCALDWTSLQGCGDERPLAARPLPFDTDGHTPSSSRRSILCGIAALRDRASTITTTTHACRERRHAALSAGSTTLPRVLSQGADWAGNDFHRPRRAGGGQVMPTYYIMERDATMAETAAPTCRLQGDCRL